MEALDHVFQVLVLSDDVIEYLKEVQGCSRVIHIFYSDRELQQVVRESNGILKRGDFKTLRLFVSWVNAYKQENGGKAPLNWQEMFTTRTFEKFEQTQFDNGEDHQTNKQRLYSILSQVLGTNQKQMACDWLDLAFSFCEAKDLSRARLISRGFSQRVDEFAKREVCRLVGNGIRPMQEQSWMALLHGIRNVEDSAKDKIKTWDASLRREGFDIGILTKPVGESQAIVLIPLETPGVRVAAYLQFGCARPRTSLGVYTAARLSPHFLHPNANPSGTFNVCSRSRRYQHEATLTETLRRLQHELSNPAIHLSCPHNNTGINLIGGANGQGVGSRELFNEYYYKSLEVFRSYTLGKPIPSLELARIAADNKIALLRQTAQDGHDEVEGELHAN